MKRILRLQNRVLQNKLSAVLISKPENVNYLCGFIGTNGRLLVTPKKAVFITDFRYLRSAKEQLPKGMQIFDQKDGLKKLIGRFKKLGIEDEYMTYSRYLDLKNKYPKVRLRPVSGIVEDMRMIKDKDEMNIIRKAVKIASTAFDKFVKSIKIGQTEKEMEWNLLKISHDCGADDFSFPPIIAFGKNTAEVHHLNGNNKLKKGEKILIDFGIKYKNYCTDMTRVLYTDKSIFLSSRAQSRDEHKIYSTVLTANQEAINSISVGKPFIEVDKVARTVIEKAGFNEYFGHATGHGIGIEVHEQPRVSEKSTSDVQPGMLFTIEPGIYSDKLGGGVRIEDMVYVNEKGKVEVLTKGVSKEIKVLNFKS